jgi:hypothetical protein
MELERLPRRAAWWLRRAAVALVRLALALFARNLLTRRLTVRLIGFCARLTRGANRVLRSGRRRFRR